MAKLKFLASHFLNYKFINSGTEGSVVTVEEYFNQHGINLDLNPFHVTEILYFFYELYVSRVSLLSSSITVHS